MERQVQEAQGDGQRVDRVVRVRHRQRPQHGRHDPAGPFRSHASSARVQTDLSSYQEVPNGSLPRPRGFFLTTIVSCTVSKKRREVGEDGECKCIPTKVLPTAPTKLEVKAGLIHASSRPLELKSRQKKGTGSTNIFSKTGHDTIIKRKRVLPSCPRSKSNCGSNTPRWYDNGRATRSRHRCIVASLLRCRVVISSRCSSRPRGEIARGPTAITR